MNFNPIFSSPQQVALYNSEEKDTEYYETDQNIQDLSTLILRLKLCLLNVYYMPNFFSHLFYNK